jgi:ubiquinone biosynthesis protein
VKLGQFLATRPDVVGVVLARDLETLQDRMAPFPLGQAERVVAAALDKPLREVFKSFGPPVAAASIAQVHRATIATAEGERAVAVKVLRPSIERRFKVDLEAFAFAARNAEKLSVEAQRLRLVEVVETLRRSVALEMDLRLEAAALSEMAENTKDDPDFRVPAIDWERTARDVLTLDWIEATPLSDRAMLTAKGFDLPQLARAVIQTFLRQALRDGFFHADMHPGNLFVDESGHLIAVDFGIMGRLGLKERRFLAEILMGFITRDYHRVAEVHFEAGYVPRHHSVESFAQAIRAIGEPIHNRTAEDISMARLLMLLFEVTGLFDMRTRPELLLLHRAPFRAGRTARRRRRGRAGSGPLPGRGAGAARAQRRARRAARRHYPRRPRARARDGGRDRARRGAPQPLDRGSAMGDCGAARLAADLAVRGTRNPSLTAIFACNRT